MVRTDKRRFAISSLTLSIVVCVLALLSISAAYSFFRPFAKNPTAVSVNSKQSPGSVATERGQVKAKKLREIAMERDVEVEGTSGSDVGSTNLEILTKDSSAIVFGRIVDAKSFFDQSGDPVMEYGELITTEYTVEVLRVIKDTTHDTTTPPDKAAPAALQTSLKIARNGGVVYVNGHRAAVKVKGYEALGPGEQYVFFLNWSPDYKAYQLTFGISGALSVDAAQNLKPLGPSKELQAEVNEMRLETLIRKMNRQ